MVNQIRQSVRRAYMRISTRFMGLSTLWKIGVILGSLGGVCILLAICNGFYMNYHVVRQAHAEAIDSYGKDLVDICANISNDDIHGYYSDSLDINPEDKFVVLHTGDLSRLHPWHNVLPDSMRATDEDEVDWVMCVHQSTRDFSQCYEGDYVYFDMRVPGVVTVLIIDPQTRTVLRDMAFAGTPENPHICTDANTISDEAFLQALAGLMQ